MRLGYKAHGDRYSALGGTETGWQAGSVSGGTYKALKLQGDGGGRGFNSYKGQYNTTTIQSLNGCFTAKGGNFYMIGE